MVPTSDDTLVVNTHTLNEGEAEVIGEREGTAWVGLGLWSAMAERRYDGCKAPDTRSEIVLFVKCVGQPEEVGKAT